MPKTDNLDGFLSPFLRRQRMQAASPFIRGRVLDYGCGIGLVGDLPAVTDYVGVDIDPEILETASKRVPNGRFLLPRDVEAQLAGEKFDSIVGLALIEHLPDPESFLRQARSLLAPDGRVVLTTPNPALDWAHGLGAKFGIFASESHDEHQSLMGREIMAAHARQAGLHIDIYRRFLLGANQLAILKHA